MNEKKLSEFITNTVMCNINQLIAYTQMQNTFSQVFNLDIDCTISVFTCASPASTLKGVFLGIVELYFGEGQSKKLSAKTNEKICRMIELTAETNIDTDAEQLHRLSKLLTTNVLTLAANDLRIEEDISKHILAFYQ